MTSSIISHTLAAVPAVILGGHLVTQNDWIDIVIAVIAVISSWLVAHSRKR